MKKLSFILTALLFVVNIYAVEPIVIPVWPDEPQVSNGLKPEDEKWDRHMLRGVSQPTLTVYPAENPNGQAVVMCPGGAYIALAMGPEGTDHADYFNSMGITLAVLKYRMPMGHHEIPLSDAEQAMRIMREHAAEWGINPNAIGVAGSSAGGHLAASLSTLASSPAVRPDFCILFYPVITMEKGVTHQGSRDNLLGTNQTDELVKRYTLEKQVGPNTPPTIIFVSIDDDLVPVENSLRYSNTLIANGVYTAMGLFPTGRHGWCGNSRFTWRPTWHTMLKTFLEQLPK